MFDRLSIPFRQALSRLTLPVLIVAAFCLMLLAKADVLLAQRLRMAVGDGLTPVYAALATPIADLRDAFLNATRGLTVMHDNAVLREQNEKLRKWQTIALALDAENAELKAQLHYIPQAAPRFVTAPVVADTGGIFARSVLVATGPGPFVAKGQVVLDATGLVGRVTERGTRSARILLITDLNSRVPVMLTASHAHAIMEGTNTDRPRLAFLPQGVRPAEGERVVTSAEAGVYPPGLPVGTVHLQPGGGAEIVPDAALGQLGLVRIFDYGLSGLLPAPPPPAPPSPRAPESALPAAPPSWRTTPDRAADNRAAWRQALRAHAALAAHPPGPDPAPPP